MAKGKKTGGRKEGTPNTIASDTREAFKTLVESNHNNMTLWLTEVADKDPAKALEIIAKLAEYCIPKLARAVDENGKDAISNLTFIIKKE